MPFKSIRFPKTKSVHVCPKLGQLFSDMLCILEEKNPSLSEIMARKMFVDLAVKHGEHTENKAKGEQEKKRHKSV